MNGAQIGYARCVSVDAAAPLLDALRPLRDAVRAGDRHRAAALLRELPRSLAELLPAEWIDASATALERDDYDALAPRFARADFVGPRGHLLIVAPYVVRRATGDDRKLSLLFAEVLPHKRTPGLDETVETIQRAKLRQPVTPVFPIKPLAVVGNTEDLSFIVPDGWIWRDSGLGPPFWDLALERKMYLEAGRRCIERIFDADTAACVLAPLDPDDGVMVQYRSFEIHDAGHASGLGLTRKNNDGLIPGYWYRGIEEWRADAIGFEVGARLLPPLEAAADVASNFCVRFGQIPPTTPGPDGPTEHTTCTLLMLDRLLREGNLVARGDRLGLRDPTPEGLVRAMEPQRNEIIELTRQELDLTDASGVMRLYGSLSLHRATIVVYQAMMHEPTRGFYKGVFEGVL